MRILITGACGVTSRAVARSLRLSKVSSNLYLVGTDVCDNPYGLYEGIFDNVYRLPRVNEPGYCDWMKVVCRTEQVDAALVIPELEVLYWARNGFPVPAVLPPPQFCAIAVSKKRLYQVLASTGLVPQFRIQSRSELMDATNPELAPAPCWIRDFTEGSSSGKGSFLARSPEDVRAWVLLNHGVEHFMLAEHLPGSNFACHLLYNRGKIVKIASYQRLEYFMARNAMSGITGNISKGRLVNDARLVKAAESAVEQICQITSETMHGLVAVDFRESRSGVPMITEINLRHVAATSSFAAAGFNLAEAQLLLTLNRFDELGPTEVTFPKQNMIFRDIDGAPIWVADYKPLSIGEGVPRGYTVKASDMGFDTPSQGSLPS